MADVFELNKLSYVIVFGAMIFNLGTGILDPTIAIYLQLLGESTESIGRILAVRWLMVAIFSIPFALLSTKIGQIIVLQMASIFAVMGGIVLIFIGKSNGVYLFYLLMGMASAASSGPGAAILAENRGTKRIAAFALYSTTWMIPPALGAAVSAWFFRNTNTYSTNLLSSIFPITLYILFSGGIIYLLLLNIANKFSDVDFLDNLKADQLPVLSQFKVIFAPVILLPFSLLLLVNFLNGSGAGSTLPFLPPYLKGLGASATYISLLVLLQNILMAIAIQITVPLARIFGDLKMFAIGTILSVICLLGLVFTTNLQYASIFFILRATFANMTSPIGQSRIIAYIDNSVRSTGSALSSNIRWVGWSIFSPISGHIIDVYGYQLSFIFTSVIYLVATFIFIYVNLKMPNLEDINSQSGDLL